MYLGIDLGTTNIKAVLTDEKGNIVAGGSVGVSLQHLPGNGVVQNLDEIWNATKRAVRQAIAGKGDKVRAIGVSSQGAALQLLNADGDDVGPVISWMDCRAQEYDEELTRRLGGVWLREHTGHAFSMATPGQLLRIRAENTLPADVRVGFVGDRIVHRLCGCGAHDSTSLSIAMLCHPSTGQADEDLLAELQLRNEQLPTLLPAVEPAGELRQDIADELGLARGIPVSPAIHDQYASVLGAGCVNTGDVMFGSGTAWVLLANASEPSDPTEGLAFVSRHILPGIWGHLLSMVNGGSALKWAMKLTGTDSLNAESLEALLASAPPGCDGLQCIPHFTPTPLSPGSARLVGLQFSHDAAHILRAVIEGLVCGLRHHLEVLAGNPRNVKHLVMTGKAASSNVTSQIVANITGLQIACVEESAVSALGAATLAHAIAENTALPELAKQRAGTLRRLEPDANHTTYQELYHHYQAFLGKKDKAVR